MGTTRTGEDTYYIENVDKKAVIIWRKILFTIIYAITVKGTI